MKELIKQLLTEPDGRYSKKSIITMVTFIFTLMLASFIVIDNAIQGKDENRAGIELFDSLLIFLATSLGISLADRKLKTADKPKEETNE